MNISKFVMAMVIVSALVVGISSFYGEVATQYGVSVDDYSYINKSVELNEKITDMKETLEGAQLTTEFGILNLPYTIVSGAISAVTVSFATLDIFGSLTADISAALLIPAWATNMMLSLVSILLLSGVIYLFLKVKW